MNANQPRRDACLDFAQAALGTADLAIAPASSDASFRSYWRVSGKSGDTHVVMDAPPDREDLAPWLDVAQRLESADVHVPHVIAVDRDRGFVLMEDLGSRTYLPELDAGSADLLYADALDALLRMQRDAATDGLPDYDGERLTSEMALMPRWFLARHLGFESAGADQHVIDAAFEFLAHASLEQPRAFVHRDFHSRNLLVVDDTAASPGAMRATPGVIDFQDAVVGPVTYDLVSLLRDCYIEWPAARVEGWMEAHRLRLRDAHVIGIDIDSATFRRWFDLIGVQRHLKVLGIFCRLWYRDGKRQYLDDLALVWRYTIDVGQRFPELGALVALLERARGDRDLAIPREEGV